MCCRGRGFRGSADAFVTEIRSSNALSVHCGRHQLTSPLRIQSSVPGLSILAIRNDINLWIVTEFADIL